MVLVCFGQNNRPEPTSGFEATFGNDVQQRARAEGLWHKKREQCFLNFVAVESYCDVAYITMEQRYKHI